VLPPLPPFPALRSADAFPTTASAFLHLSSPVQTQSPLPFCAMRSGCRGLLCRAHMTIPFLQEVLPVMRVATALASGVRETLRSRSSEWSRTRALSISFNRGRSLACGDERLFVRTVLRSRRSRFSPLTRLRRTALRRALRGLWLLLRRRFSPAGLPRASPASPRSRLLLRCKRLANLPKGRAGLLRVPAERGCRLTAGTLGRCAGGEVRDLMAGLRTAWIGACPGKRHGSASKQHQSVEEPSMRWRLRRVR